TVRRSSRSSSMRFLTTSAMLFWHWSRALATGGIGNGWGRTGHQDAIFSMSAAMARARATSGGGGAPCATAPAQRVVASSVGRRKPVMTERFVLTKTSQIRFPPPSCHQELVADTNGIEGTTDNDERLPVIKLAGRVLGVYVIL